VTQFILRRILVTIPVLLGIIFIVFALARLVPVAAFVAGVFYLGPGARAMGRGLPNFRTGISPRMRRRSWATL